MGTAPDAVSPQDARDWSSFASRIGFAAQCALPDDYEDRLAERLFGSDELVSNANFSGLAQIAECGGMRLRTHSSTRQRALMAILLAAAAVLIVWMSAGSPSPAASPHARDADTPAVHAVDDLDTPSVAPVEECQHAEPAPLVDPPAPEPNPGRRFARHAVRPIEKQVRVVSEATTAPQALIGASFTEGREVLAPDADEVLSPPAPSDASDASPSLAVSVPQFNDPIFDARAATQLEDWKQRPVKGARSWVLAPTGERWLGVGAQPSDMNAPRAIAITAQLDVARAIASF